MKKIICILLLFVATNLQAQNFPSSVSKEQTVYLYRVKTIEDLMYRFNNDTMSSLRTGLAQYNVTKAVDRIASLKTCFNLENPTFAKDTIARNFIKYVLEPSNNCVLHFEDSNWYCKIVTTFIFRGSEVEIPLVLKVVNFGDRGSRWFIEGIGDNNVFNRASGDTILKSQKLVKKSISATNYAVNFLDLNRIFTKSLNEKTCFSPNLLKTEKAKKFINLIKTGELEMSSAVIQRFYLLQIPGYVLEVDDINRMTNNSGWLITKVYKATDAFKDNYKARLLKY